MRRLLAAAAGAWALLVVLAAPASAHPLGNFTANTYAGLIVGRSAVRIDYVLDLAEIPTFQLTQRIDRDGDGEIAGGEGDDYRASECGAIADGLTLAVDGRSSAISVEGSTLAFPPGEAGLRTLRLECAMVAATGPLTASSGLAFADATRRDRIGWREITAVGDLTTLTTHDVPATSTSDRLRTYPADRLASPLDQRAARLEVDATHGAPAPLPDVFAATGRRPAADRLTAAFTALVARQSLHPGFGAVAFAIALGLGALHAFAPGHGKTVMAAYLLASGDTGQRRRARPVLQLGLVVAATHTVGVLGLGLLVSASQTIAPERLYPGLGFASGLLFAVVGLTLVPAGLRRWREVPHHHHTHDHDHEAPGWRGLIAPGLAGGLTPSPSALVVLLAGIALGRAWFGVVLVLAYGLGMAATLVGAGWVLIRLRGRFEGRLTAGGRLAAVTRALPLATSCLVVLGGLAIAARAVAS